MSKEDKKNRIIIYICVAIFGLVGAYLTFIYGNINGYDSQTKAYGIDANEQTDSEGTVTYHPIYYFKVGDKNYVCKSTSGSSAYPNSSKNTVYYDSKNPEKCKTEYESSTSRVAGIICLVVAVIVFIIVVRRPASLIDQPDIRKIHVPEEDYQNEENLERINMAFGKIQLIFKRVILGVIILVLLVLILIDTAIFKQTIKAKDYVETTAIYVSDTESDSTMFNDYIYTFEDKNGVEQEITISLSRESERKDQIKIKYDENDPKNFYEETALLDKSGMTWYIVKIVIMILLIVLFFNKRILNKLGMSIRN